MYRCGLCGVCSPPRQSRRLHVVYRTVPAGRQHHVVRDHNGQPRSRTVLAPERTEIAREIPVCGECEQRLHRQAAAPPTHANGSGGLDVVLSGRTVRTVLGNQQVG